MKRFLSGKKRYTIALQMIQMGFGYGSMLWQGAADAAEERNVNLIIFPGKALNAPDKFDRQNNILYQFINNNNTDAFIMISTLLANYIKPDDFKRFYNRLRPMPIINIGEPLPGIPSIIIDNKTGIRDLAGHLINVHRCRKIAFVKGLEGNNEAGERFQAYREALEENHLPFDPGLVASGDFSRDCAKDSMQELFGKKQGKIDAIMFANDEMAISSMRYLKTQGYKIPGDFALTGFDNIDEIEYETPPLTTVRQPLYEQTQKAVELAIDIIEGREVPELTVLPTRTIIRSSCGCLSKAVNQIGLITEQIRNQKEKAGNNSRWPAYDVVIRDIKSLSDIEPDMPDSFFLNIREAYAGFINYADCSIKKEDINECSIQFLKILNQILINEIQSGRDVSIWQLIIKLMAEKLIMFKPELNDFFNSTAFINQISVMIGEMNKLNQGYIRIKDFWQYMTLRDITYWMLSIQNSEELLDYLVNHLPGLGLNTCIITQYEKEWRHTGGDIWEFPGKQNVLLYFDKKGRKQLRGPLSRPYSTSRLLPDGITAENNRHTFIITPLFSRETHYGNIVFELGPRQGFIYESLSAQIAIIYRSALLFKERETAENNLKMALSELEKYNQQLNRLSLTDDMTGLYNRRGFMNLARNNLSLARRLGKPGIIIFADLDGLKNINDTYGHKEGDWAIKEISVILRNTFRNTDIIARLGGDEFTVFMIDAQMDQLSIFKKRIEKLLIDSNYNSKKPYKLSISIGSVYFQPDASVTIDDLLKEADKMLYSLKKEKKKRN